MFKQFSSTRNVIILLLVLLIGLSQIPPGIAHAQAGLNEAQPLKPLFDPAELELYWNDFFSEQMEQFGVYGAEMVMVKDGEILFSQGYGYADADRQIPYDPERTIIRSGSIVKTVTAAAVMQLSEQGKLDLDADVNQYLTLFKVPEAFGQPVTTRQLINMTGGFDTRLFGVRVPSPEELQPLGQYLAKRMPPRTRPPGLLRRYNDHEIALAGYLVEVISGMPYEQYVQKYIFEPLEMNHSSITLPDDQLDQVVRGYPVGGGTDDAYPLSYYYLNDAPGGGFNSTGMDIAHYMMSQLQNGRYVRSDGGEVRILSEETAAAMHETAFRYSPYMVGQANSWDEEFYNGQRYLRKDGGAPGVLNRLLLFKDQGLGFYLNYNSDGYALSNNWRDKILTMYLGERADETRPSLPVPGDAGPLDRYVGSYIELHDSTADGNLIKLNALITPGEFRKVTANDDGTLSIDGHSYSAIEPGLFQSSSGESIITFEMDGEGPASYLFQNRFAYARVPWYETPVVQQGLLAATTLLFFSGVIAWLVSAIRRQATGRRLAGLISLLNIVFLIGLVLVLLPAVNGVGWVFFFDPSPQLLVVLTLPLIAALFTVALLVQTFLSWIKGRYTAGIRLHNTLILLGAIGFFYFLSTWNLLGYQF